MKGRFTAHGTKYKLQEKQVLFAFNLPWPISVITKVMSFKTLIGSNPCRASHKTACEQLAHTRCSDFDKPCLYHPLIHPPPPPHVITLCPIRLSNLSWAFIYECRIIHKNISFLFFWHRLIEDLEARGSNPYHRPQLWRCSDAASFTCTCSTRMSPNSSNDILAWCKLFSVFHPLKLKWNVWFSS